jgi:hypothetical protein
MSRSRLFKRRLVLFFFLLALIPAGAFGQEQGSGSFFKAEELDQMLAPIALYPDSLLAQILVAATYPEQVTAASRWASENGNLKGERLNAALDKQKWDLSVKALVPFPDVLAMMSERPEWTQKLGETFMSQQDDVMDAVQRLRARAHEQGNLNTTSQQKVLVQEEIIRIEPVNTQVVYMPIYDPVVVYGTWAYPAYPPYPAYYPSGAVVASGAMGFTAGVAVGTAWSNGWGHWDWHNHDVNVNVNRNVNINRNNVNVNNIKTTNWNDNVNRRTSADARSKAAGEQAQRGKNAAEPRRNDRVSNQGEKSKARSGSGRQGLAGRSGSGRSRPDAGVGRGAEKRPSAESTVKSLQERRAGGARKGLSSRGGSRENAASAGRANRRGPLRGAGQRDDELNGAREGVAGGPREGLGGGPGSLGQGGGLRGGGGFRGRR